MKGWYKTSDGIKHDFEPHVTINVSSRDLIELIIPNGTRSVFVRIIN